MNNQKISTLGTFIWLIAALFYLYEFFLRTFIGTVAPEVIHDLHLSISQFAWLGTAYYIAYGLMQIPVGILVDKFGTKITMVIATLMCALATFLFAHTDQYLNAFAGRFLMGLGSSFAFVCLLMIVANWFPRRFFAFFVGMSQFIGTMGPVLAGGPLVELLNQSHTSWRIALSEIGAFGIVLAILSALFVRTKPKGKKRRIKFLSKRESILSRLKKLLKNKQAWLIATYSMTTYVSISLIAALWGTEFLEDKGLTQQTAASLISVAWLSFAVACPLLGFLSDISKRRKPWLILCAVSGFLSTGLIVWLPTPPGWIYTILFCGFGIAASGQNIGFATISEQTQPSIRATAMGLNNGFITFGAALFLMFVSQIIKWEAGSSTHISTTVFSSALLSMPIINFIAILLAIFLIKETYCKPQKKITTLKPAASQPAGF